MPIPPSLAENFKVVANFIGRTPRRAPTPTLPRLRRRVMAVARIDEPPPPQAGEGWGGGRRRTGSCQKLPSSGCDALDRAQPVSDFAVEGFDHHVIDPDLGKALQPGFQLVLALAVPGGTQRQHKVGIGALGA